MLVQYTTLYMSEKRGYNADKSTVSVHNSISMRNSCERKASRPDLQRRYQGESGLYGITLNIAARTIWVYTKPVTAAIYTQLKTMLHLHSPNPHYELGAIHVARDSEMVVKVTAAMETNLFNITTTNLINISTG